jgi:hypothetical protein
MNGMLTLSDHSKDPSGVHLCPFPFFRFFFMIRGIIGYPFRHNRLSSKHNRLSF